MLDRIYRPQTKWGGVMCGRGHAWQGGVHGREVCMAGRCAWQGGVHGEGVCGRRACVAGMRAWWGVLGMPPGRYYGIRSMSGQYASYWNVFLLI